jgi:hypothetical protein
MPAPRIQRQLLKTIQLQRLTAGVCIIHLIRNTFRLASRADWDALKRDVKPISAAMNALRQAGDTQRSDSGWATLLDSLRVVTQATFRSHDLAPRSGANALLCRLQQCFEIEILERQMFGRAKFDLLRKRVIAKT